MAATFYLSSTGSDNNSGSSEGSAKASGTGAATIAGSTVTLSVDNPDLSAVVVGDTIRLNGRTDGRGSDPPNAIFEITAVDNTLKTVDVTPAPNSITSGVTWVIGGAFETLRRAMTFVHAGEKCYVKGSFTGLQDLTDVGFPGVIASTPVVIEGYETTPGDGGMATFDGQNTAAHGLWMPGITSIAFWVVKNIRVTRYTVGFDNFYGAYPTQFVNCRADHCGAGWQSFVVSNNINCYAHDNTTTGFDCHDHCEFYGCVIRDNGTGIKSDSAVRVHRCLFYHNTTYNIHITGAFTSDQTHITDSIIDGGGVSTYGIFGYASPGGGYTGMTKIINSMVINCGVGIHASGNEGLWGVNVGLLVHGNTTDFENYAGQDGLVTGEATFVNEGVDWTPATGSAAIAAAFDVRSNQYATVTGEQDVIGGIMPVAGAGSSTAFIVKLGN